MPGLSSGVAFAAGSPAPGSDSGSITTEEEYTGALSWTSGNWICVCFGEECCESAALSMPANLENSPVASGLEKISFHSSPQERQCQIMLKLPHNLQSSQTPVK